MKDANKHNADLPPAKRLNDGAQAVWKDSLDVGNCNFCTDFERKAVLQISGHCLIVRICEKCWNEIRITA